MSGVERFEYPQSPGDCYIELGEVIGAGLADDDRLILDADGASNYIANLISGFTGDEVDGDGDPWSIVCEHLHGLLHNLSEALHYTNPDAPYSDLGDAGVLVREYLRDEYGLEVNPPAKPTPQQE
jgi:hypothetical protein